MVVRRRKKNFQRGKIRQKSLLESQKWREKPREEKDEETVQEG